MAYQITHVRRDGDGDTTHVKSNYGSETVAQAISAIEYRQRSYYTVYNGQRAEVIVASKNWKKYLRSTPDGTTRNNLDYLPTF